MRLGLALAEAIDNKAVIALVGPLGVGKTALVQAVARGLGISEIVNSPTFTMLNEYHSGRLPLYHMDFYRLSEKGSTLKSMDLLVSEIDEFIEEDMVAMLEWADLLDRGNTNILDSLDCLTVELRYLRKGEDGKLPTVQLDSSIPSPLNITPSDMLSYSQGCQVPKPEQFDQLSENSDQASVHHPKARIVSAEVDATTASFTEAQQITASASVTDLQAISSNQCPHVNRDGHINKDEEGRIARLKACGTSSARILSRLTNGIADMLIYS